MNLLFLEATLYHRFQVTASWQRIPKWILEVSQFWIELLWCKRLNSTMVILKAFHFLLAIKNYSIQKLNRRLLWALYRWKSRVYSTQRLPIFLTLSFSIIPSSWSLNEDLLTSYHLSKNPFILRKYFSRRVRKLGLSLQGAFSKYCRSRPK